MKKELEIGKNRFYLNHHSVMEESYAFDRLEAILKRLPIDLHSNRDDAVYHDGTYYDGGLYALIYPKGPDKPKPQYVNILIAPTSVKKLKAKITDPSQLEGEIKLSHKKVSFNIEGNTVSIEYDNSSVPKEYIGLGDERFVTFLGPK